MKFPITNINCTDNDFKALVKLRANIKFISEVVPLKQRPIVKDKFFVENVPYISYDGLMKFKELLLEFSQEYNANRKKGLTNEDETVYRNLTRDIKECINVFNQNADVFDYDMQIIDLNKANWYKYIFDWLNDIMTILAPPKKTLSKDLLEKIYPYLKEYLVNNDKTNFVDCFIKKKKLNVANGWNNYLIYLFREICAKNVIGYDTLEPVFGTKYKQVNTPVAEKRAKMNAILRVIYPT